METSASRLEEFWGNQKKLGVGTRVLACGRLGFILEWNVPEKLDKFLKGDFSILYDSGDYQSYNSFFLRNTLPVLDNEVIFLNPPSWREAYERYCENVFLSRLAK